ncbi:DedA family protein [Rickettsiales bacterium]|nr:DedA family protein [Rickettsiales bacterium]
MFDLVLLFLSAFFAATIFPAGSEIMLAYLVVLQNHDPYLLLIIATIGNVLGSITNYILGYYLIKFKNNRFFTIKDKKIKKYSKIYQKWGIYSLLFAWLPIVGDPLTLISGIFKTNIWTFLLLVTIGKAARYIFIIFLF